MDKTADQILQEAMPKEATNYNAPPKYGIVILDAIEFLELITYNQLFNYVHVPSHIGASLSLADPDKKLCVCEPVNIDTTCIWYPISSWIAECKRRKSIDDKSAEFRASYVAPKEDIVELKKMLLKAAMSGDTNEVGRLTKLIQENAQTKS